MRQLHSKTFEGLDIQDLIEISLYLQGIFADKLNLSSHENKWLTMLLPDL